MKHLFYFLPFVVFISFGQESKVKQGIAAYEQKKYNKALNLINEGFEIVEDLKPKVAAEGFYYRHLSRQGFALELGERSNTKDLTEHEKYILENWIFNGFIDLRTAIDYDIKGKLTDLAQSEMDRLIDYATLVGLNYFQTASSYSGKDKESFLGISSRYFRTIIEERPENYLAHDILGQIHMEFKQYKKAFQEFNLAIENYNEFPPTVPDYLIAYSYYRKALVSSYYLPDVGYNAKNSLATIREGLVTLDKVHSQLESTKGENDSKYKPEQYRSIRADLETFELDLLLQLPDKLDETINRLEKETSEEPKNYLKHVAYAQLLEQKDFSKAEEVYLKATEIEPKNIVAWYNLGAMYVNKAVTIYQEANELENFTEADKKTKEGNEWYKKALDTMQKAHAIEPCEKEILRTLQMISIQLNESDLYAEYKKKAEDCQ